jgi:regulator of replication initiation timing
VLIVGLIGTYWGVYWALYLWPMLVVALGAPATMFAIRQARLKRDATRVAGVDQWLARIGNECGLLTRQLDDALVEDSNPVRLELEGLRSRLASVKNPSMTQVMALQLDLEQTRGRVATAGSPVRSRQRAKRASPDEA